MAGRLRSTSVWLAALALPFHALTGWPLQPAELLAVPLLLFAGWSFARGARVSWTSVDTGVLSWCAAVPLSVALQKASGHAPDAVVLLDVAKTLYLGLLYAGLRVTCAGEDGSTLAARAYVAGSAVMAALGLLGAVANQLGAGTPLAFDAGAAYPYLGHAARARALTATPNMLASIAMLALQLLWSGAARPMRARRLVTTVLAIGFAATASKTVVALGVGLFVVWALRKPPSLAVRAAAGLAWVAGLLVFGVLSHVAVVCDEAEHARLERAMFIAGEPLPFDLPERCAAYATNYAFNKKASLLAIEGSWPVGIGPGKHPEFVAGLERQGRYPSTLWPAVPHSSYTGIPAELGLTGLLGFGILAASLLLGARRGSRAEQPSPLAIAAAGAMAAVSIETLATDVMHFRHYAWLAALVAAANSRQRG